MTERDIAKLRGDYNREHRRADKLQEKLDLALEIANQQKQSLDNLTAENSKLKRKIKRQQNRKS